MNNYTDVKHFRLQFDFTITIDESAIPTEGIHAQPRGIERTGDDEEWREGDERSRRLFRAVVANKDAFDAYLLYELVSQIDSMTWQDWHSLLLGSPCDDMKVLLSPAIAAMDEADQEFFAQAEEHEVFFENTEEFQDCFQASLDDVRIVDMGDKA